MWEADVDTRQHTSDAEPGRWLHSTPGDQVNASRIRAPMNAIVLIALKRPYTFVVLAILILVFGGRAALQTPTDIFPNIGIPVVAAVWTYNGLTPEDVSGRVVYYYERALTTTVSNIEHIESESLYGR